MKVLYAITRWSNANRSHARHIDNGQGKPLCKTNSKRRMECWQEEDSKPNCLRCLKLQPPQEGEKT